MNKHLLVLCVAALLLLPASPAFGCSCIQKSFADQFKEAKAVFAGKVVAFETRKRKHTVEAEPAEVEAVVVKFEVERWWKGGSSAEVIIFQDSYKYGKGADEILVHSSCDHDFEEGKRYLVYAYDNENGLNANCTRTTWMEHATEDLKELGEGAAPTAERQPS